MAKIIKITPDLIDSMREEFEKAIEKAKLSNGTFTFSKSFNKIDRKATLYYREHAWQKQEALVDNFEDEVAWHGIAKRDPEEKDSYIIEDIIVYPQEVTGATVTTDQNAYQEWLYAFDDDIFNNIRMQGHSHVRMGVTPSAVDKNLYDDILSQLNGEMFYIFAIFNKRGDRTIMIYDMAENIFFDNADVKLMIIEDGPKLQTFIEEAKELVKKKTYTAPATTGNTAAAHNVSQTNNAGSNKVPTGTQKKGKKKASSGYNDYGYASYNDYYNSAQTPGGSYPNREYYDDYFYGKL